MKYPSLVRHSQCKTPIKITVYTGDIDEDGAPEILAQIDTKCNYQSKTQTVYNANKEVIAINGSAYFVGDILPDISEILDGEVEVLGMKHKIHRSIKARNDDGSVNYTKLELI
jgi:hypothetical protein